MRNLTSINRISTLSTTTLWRETADAGRGEAKKSKENETNTKLSKLAGVGKETYRMGAKILNSDNEKLKQEVLSGEKSINAGYKELTGKKENQYI